MHFIMQHQNPSSRQWEEKHYKAPPPIKKDQLTHLYTLAIYGATNRFEIFIDKQSVASGSFFDDMIPPLTAPEFVADPTDEKPANWPAHARIPDLAAVKPDTWDDSQPRYVPDSSDLMPAGWLQDEPLHIPGPAAERPEDWEEEDDGEWECPLVPNPVCELASTPGCGAWSPRKLPNPAFVGEWVPPLIENPLYKGEWVPRQIPNPHYYQESHPAIVAPMSGIAVEVWTTSAGIHFDNFLITRSVEVAFNYSAITFDIKSYAENAALSKEIERAEKDKIVSLKASGKTWNIMLALLLEFVYSAKKNWKMLLATTVVIIGAFVFAFVNEMGTYEHTDGEDMGDTDDDKDVDRGGGSAERDESTLGIMSPEVQEALDSLDRDIDVDDFTARADIDADVDADANVDAKGEEKEESSNSSSNSRGLDNDDPRVERILRERLLALLGEDDDVRTRLGGVPLQQEGSGSSDVDCAEGVDRLLSNSSDGSSPSKATGLRRRK